MNWYTGNDTMKLVSPLPVPVHAKTTHTVNLPVGDQLANFAVCFQTGLLHSTNQWLHQIQLVDLH